MPPKQTIATEKIHIMTKNYQSFFTSAQQSPTGISQGYPVPGIQTTDAKDISEDAFLVREDDLNDLKKEGFDFIIIGTGPCAVAFIDQLLSKNPYIKILVIDRGEFWLPVHYQMLSPAFQATTSTPPTTYPWTRTRRMVDSKHHFFQAGYMPLLGGRSSYWSAWCPTPTRAQMRDWPESLVDITQKPEFWNRAKKFLHVTSMDQIQNGIYGSLQAQLDTHLSQNFKKHVPSATSAFPAPIAVKIPEWKSVRFFKYSTVGSLFQHVINQQELAKDSKGTELKVLDKCIVKRLIHDDAGSVTAIETSRGCFATGNAKIILGMGTIPPATLLMESFGNSLPNIGNRYTGHFMSHVTARVKRSAFTNLSDLEIAAVYLDGLAPNGLQYHVQTSAFSSRDPKSDTGTITREAPDAAAVVSPEQLQDSEDYVIFVCATLGEISEKNEHNWIKKHSQGDPTSNISIQLVLGPEDEALWDVLDEATYQTLEALVTNHSSSQPKIEFWIEEEDNNGFWSDQRPDQDQIRLDIIVHEASPLWMGNDPKSSVVSADFRPHGIKNVYVTGASIFPTCGSWNPTLTMCGLAQELADQLS